MNKENYHKIKRQIKCLCKSNFLNLCNEVGLNDYEKDLLLSYYNGKTQVQTCIDMNISLNTYTNHLRIIINKIYDYKNTK